MSKLPLRLKNLRINADMTQTELASLLGVSQNAIFNWENGKREPSQLNIEKLADIFKVSPAYLMGWETPNAIASATITLYNVHCETEDETKLILSYRELNNVSKQKVTAYTETLLTAQKMEREALAARTQAGTNPAPEAPKDTEN